MVVLADEILESFFETDLSASFRLEPIPEADTLPPASSGLLGDLWSTIATDTNKKIFNMFTDEIGKTIGKHQVCNFTHPFLRCSSHGYIGHSKTLHWEIHQTRGAKGS
jgi:hypothetical protein